MTVWPPWPRPPPGGAPPPPPPGLPAGSASAVFAEEEALLPGGCGVCWGWWRGEVCCGVPGGAVRRRSMEEVRLSSLSMEWARAMSWPRRLPNSAWWGFPLATTCWSSAMARLICEASPPQAPSSLAILPWRARCLPSRVESRMTMFATVWRMSSTSAATASGWDDDDSCLGWPETSPRLVGDRSFETPDTTGPVRRWLPQGGATPVPELRSSSSVGASPLRAVVVRDSSVSRESASKFCWRAVRSFCPSSRDTASANCSIKGDTRSPALGCCCPPSRGRVSGCWGGARRGFARGWRLRYHRASPSGRNSGNGPSPSVVGTPLGSAAKADTNSGSESQIESFSVWWIPGSITASVVLVRLDSADSE
mmetsp:Transcript_7943/g.26072  ORF Transcript_7943/g.26072 Transcript_7943/m.26072 type:complete len:366 (-) Transcript_7943:135-1232(-)